MIIKKVAVIVAAWKQKIRKRKIINPAVVGDFFFFSQLFNHNNIFQDFKILFLFSTITFTFSPASVPEKYSIHVLASMTN
ncbi:hypothetical protein HZA96_01110 [Candidatus Woesearchaeota archaeon]|nr:hypothetical protein [Candidatus Woesearchaeota archaeon]